LEVATAFERMEKEYFNLTVALQQISAAIASTP
jgi:hypothetical protein